jgi:hypothetical protein
VLDHVESNQGFARGHALPLTIQTPASKRNLAKPNLGPAFSKSG